MVGLLGIRFFFFLVEVAANGWDSASMTSLVEAKPPLCLSDHHCTYTLVEIAQIALYNNSYIMIA